MKIIKPSFTFEQKINGLSMLKNIERAGRTCYKSESKITAGSARKFVDMIIRSGHESVLEHEKITVRVICDRGVTHEVVRHRIGASYSQESTRYCNYGQGKFGGEIAVILPFFFDRHAKRQNVKIPSGWKIARGGRITLTKRLKAELNEFDVWFAAMLFSEWAYLTLVSQFGRTAQEARSVLPNSLKTEIVVTYNLREWRHFFKLRTAKRAHPQMREITVPMLKEFQQQVPVVFDDIKPE